MTNGCLEIDNNGAERATKLFIIDRKKLDVFQDSKGVESSVLLYSVTEKTKSNGSVAEKCLVYLFEMLANSEIKEMNMLEKSMH